MAASRAKKPHAPKKGLILGIDLGGTKILAAVVNPYNRIQGRAKRATPFMSSEQVLTNEIIGCAEDALRTAGITHSELRSIGMGSPGPLDPETGVVLRTGNIAMRNYPIGQILAKHFGVPVYLDNDVHMGCFGELKAGAGLGCRNIIGIFIGTGIGGCVIRDGEVVHGANRNAGEIGHVILDARHRFGDKQRGSLETEAGKNGIAAFIRRRIGEGQKSRLRKLLKGDKDRLKSSDLAKAFKKGDKLAIAAIEHSALYTGLAVANLFNVLSPELFVLGGGVVEAIGKPYLKLVKKAANKYVYTTELAPIRIVQAQLGDDAGVLGAALAARERL
ncbi:MAG: ROK family protein [Planctomycetota bacterium]